MTLITLNVSAIFKDNFKTLFAKVVCVYIYKIIIFFLLFTDFKIVSTFFFLILVIKFKRRRIIPKREINTVSASVILQKVYHWITSSSSSPLPGFSHENRDISVSLGNFINRRHLFFFLFFFVEQRREIFFILVRAIEDRSSRERKKKKNCWINSVGPLPTIFITVISRCVALGSVVAWINCVVHRSRAIINGV